MRSRRRAEPGAEQRGNGGMGDGRKGPGRFSPGHGVRERSAVRTRAVGLPRQADSAWSLAVTGALRVASPLPGDFGEG